VEQRGFGPVFFCVPRVAILRLVAADFQ